MSSRASEARAVDRFPPQDNLPASATLPAMDALAALPDPLGFGVRELAAVARAYCGVIDSSGAGRPRWLREVAMLLPRLHAAMASVHRDAEAAAAGAAQDYQVDLDARFELFSHLRAELGDRDGYFLEFDRFHDFDDADEGGDLALGETMTGSLADDLTDIYCELKQGLRAFEAEPAQALDAWCRGFEQHWGAHLVDAERHLASLAASGRLG